MHYVNPTLEESEFDVAIIQVCVNNLLNCQGDINQINNILQNIEHIYRQYGVKNILLSALIITDRIPEQLIKDFNISVCNIRSQTPNCNYIDNANTALNDVCRDGLHLSCKGNYVMINNYLDRFVKFF